eukprot:536815_1
MAEQKFERKEESPELYLTDITVEYKDNQASYPEYITEVDKGSNDINKDFKGKFVYLATKWGSAENAISHIGFIRNDKKQTGANLRGDLAKGAGGQFRYITLGRDKQTAITKIQFWRTTHKNSKPSKEGWRHWSDDLNSGRKGDHLYLCYQKVKMKDLKKKKGKILRIDFDLDKVSMSAKEPHTIVTQPTTNDTDTEQDGGTFNVGEDDSETSTFTYTGGFEIEVGTEFSAGVPFVSNAKVKVGVKTSHSWSNGTQNTITKKWNVSFNTGKCPPHKTIIAKAVVWKQTVDVPYTMIIQCGDGSQTKSFGTWRGVCTYDIRREFSYAN